MISPLPNEFSEEDVVGRVINGKFRLEKVVGVGAWGAVYQAEQLSLGRSVAIKLLKPQLARDKLIVQRFHDEALAASRLNHPNTVSILDYGQTDDGLLFIVMEFLRGKTLTQIIQSKVELTTAKIADIVAQILRGLEEAHAAGIIHSDLKGDNIMLVPRRSGREQVKVVDFGIARVIGRADTGPIKDSTTVLGTPEYMSPEVITGEKPTAASDIYSVGIVLYELLCGVTPFAGRPTLETLSGHIRETPRPPSALAQHLVGSHIEKVALKALEKDPAKRFQSAVAFAKALESTSNAKSAPVILCEGCGVESPVDFKFCPDCGQQRQQLSAVPEPNTPAGTASKWLGDARTLSSIPKLSSTAEVCTTSALPLPVVGRDDEIAAVAGFLVNPGAGRPLRIVGAPGSGKSTVLWSAVEQAGDEGAVVYLADPDPTGLATPLYPVRAVLAALLEISAVPNDDELLDALDRRGIDTARQLSIRYVFGGETLDALEPPVRRSQLLASLSSLMGDLICAERAVLVFEDVDRFDAASTRVLQHLLTGDVQNRPPIVVTHSTDMGEQVDASFLSVELESLTDASLDAIGAHLAEHGSTVTPTADELRSRNIRTPEHIEELVRYVVEGGDLDSAPAGLADIISERVELLAYSAKLLAQVTAAFGMVAPRRLLAAAAEQHLGGEDLEMSLALLQARGILSSNEDAVWFEQHLVRDIVYESTPADVRRTLHRLVVATLEGMDIPAFVFGHHYELAGRDELATEWFGYAGEDALRLFDEPSASAAFERGLSAARRVLHRDPTPENEGLYASLSIRLAESLRMLGKLALARGILFEAKRVCSVREWAGKIEHAQAHVLAANGQLAKTAEALRCGIAESLAAGDIDCLIDLYLDLSAVLLLEGDTVEAASELDEVVNLLTFGEGPSATDGPRRLWKALLRIGKVRAMLGDLPAAIEVASHARRHAMRIGNVIAGARIDTFLALQYQATDEPLLYKKYLDRGTQVLRDHGDMTEVSKLLVDAATLTSELPRVEGK